jgi:hypothetical protein
LRRQWPTRPPLVGEKFKSAPKERTVAGPVPSDDYTDDELEAEGMAIGLDVWPVVMHALTRNYDGDEQLANAQLWSLRRAIRAEVFDELGHPGLPGFE